MSPLYMRFSNIHLSAYIGNMLDRGQLILSDFGKCVAMDVWKLHNVEPHDPQNFASNPHKLHSVAMWIFNKIYLSALCMGTRKYSKF